MEENLTVIKNPKSVCLNFDSSKYLDDNFKHEIEFILKSNESLA